MTEETIETMYDLEYTPVIDNLPIPDAVSFTEAPASANFKAHSSGGWTVQYTLRDVDEDLLLDRLARFIRKLEGMKFTPANGETYHPAPSQLPAQPAATPPPTNNQPPPLPVMSAPVAQPAQVQQPLSFNAESLIANVADGKVYWKIKGGKFSQYGVTVWPECLRDAGITPEALDPMQSYSLVGYIAYYENNDQGKAHKVTKLLRM